MAARGRWRPARLARWGLAVVAAAVAFLALTLAVPVPTWRSGEIALPPLQRDAAPLAAARRIWIDTDAACGTGGTRDPDDCLALLLLLRTDEVQVAGVSSVFGNAPLSDTDATLRELLAQLRADGERTPAAWRGCAVALDDSPCPADTPAVRALARALEDAPLTVLALGPLTNIATLLESRPDLAPRIVRVVAVMGRRPGHRFHPSTAAQEAPSGATPMLLGHGPLFRDLNFVLDRSAARRTLAAQLPLTLVPYDAARNVRVAPRELEQLRAQGGAAAWVAQQSTAWLRFWQAQVGVDGFMPFDLVAAAHLIVPARFDCPAVQAWIGRDPLLGVLDRAPALLVAQAPPPADALAQAPARYCMHTDVRVRELFE
jgi:inosine-uridine nucleoside N-ribohydrolase